MFNYIIYLLLLTCSAEIINLKPCEYKMYQHIQCNNINIKLSYKAYANNTTIPKPISFITTTQQYCDEYKNLCKLDQYYPRLSVIKESSFNDILKDNANDDDDICMIFIVNNKKDVDLVEEFSITNKSNKLDLSDSVTINYTLSHTCLDTKPNSISTVGIIIICVGIVSFLIIGYVLYYKHKNNKKEITKLKVQLKKYSNPNNLTDEYVEHIHYPINIDNGYTKLSNDV
jgi:hypothetical protein